MDPNQHQLLLTGGAKDSTYVEDVFSNNVHIGTDDTFPISNNLKLGNSNSGSSVRFMGHGGPYGTLTQPHTTDLCFGTGDFTIEAWVYHVGNFGGYEGIFGNWGGSGDSYIWETVGAGASSDIEFYYYNTGGTFVGPVQGAAVPKNQWVHLAVCRDGSTIRMFVNGTMHGTGTSISTGFQDGSTPFQVGAVGGAGSWNGYVSDLRVTKGQALYTANFTPSTELLTTTSQGAIAGNVKLLCCQGETATDATVTPGTLSSVGMAFRESFGRFTADDGVGGMVWIKARDVTDSHHLVDTERGVNKILKSNNDTAEVTLANSVTAFNNNGFSLGSASDVNWSGKEYTSWSFRKAPGFFDIVTYTGNGTTGQNISHNLECVPGCIMVKKTTSTGSWFVYHRSRGKDYAGMLNSSNSFYSTANWDNTDPTSTHFTVKHGDSNEDGSTYVAYLFAHEEAAFGPNSDQSIISCGSFEGNNSTDGPIVTLPFEPAYIILKASDSGGSWYLLDTMRGIGPDNNQNEVVTRFLKGDTTVVENYTNIMKIDNSNGFRFKITDSDGEYNASTMVFIAIAAETGRTTKEIEAGSASNVFAIDGIPLSTEPNFESGFPVDIALVKAISAVGNWTLTGRKLQSTYLEPNGTGVRGTGSTNYTFDLMDGMWKAPLAGTSNQAWMWKRHAGFDVVEYKGSGSADYVYHSLGRLPDMMWVKQKNGSGNWRVYHKGLGTSNDPFDYSLYLNDNAAQIDDATVWNDAAPELTRFTVGTNSNVNTLGEDYIAMLFANVAGISKCESFTGNSSDQNIDLGFQPRFFMVKKYSGTGNWYVFDTVRGIVAGNDARIQLDQNEAQNTSFDCLDLTPTGVTLHNPGSWFNESGDSYIYYAHA